MAGDRKEFEPRLRSELPEEERLEEKELTSYVSTWAGRDSNPILSATCSLWLPVVLRLQAVPDSASEIEWPGLMMDAGDARRGILG